VYAKTEFVGIVGADFLSVGCPPCCTTSSIKALKRKFNTQLCEIIKQTMAGFVTKAVARGPMLK